jgi:hypothetical protein
MRARMRLRFFFECVFATLMFAVTILTLSMPNWLEQGFGIHGPWHGKGYLEDIIVAVGLVLFITTTALARVEWKRTPALATIE